MYIHACSSMDHFDPTSITHEADNNWALKATNLRKLVRNLQDYYHEVLNKDADFESILSNVNDTAKDSDAEGILAIVELVAVAAISCEDREVFVNRMREISEENLGEFQMFLKSGMEVCVCVQTFSFYKTFCPPVLKCYNLNPPLSLAVVVAPVVPAPSPDQKLKYEHDHYSSTSNSFPIENIFPK